MDTEKKTIPFSPPDITDEEINEVIDTLKSGWITTGPKTKRFEEMIASFCETKSAKCLSSATAGLELVLRLFDIGPGDEVITSAYTFAASVNVILHAGAKPVLVDTKKDSFNIDPVAIKKAITDKTKAVIPVDFAGLPCDYDEINKAVISKKHLFVPLKTNEFQQELNRILILSDSAHSFGSTYKNKKSGNLADFSVFSFHAVKNLTTAEGGSITFNDINTIKHQEIYKKLSLLSLHGQSKDAFSKMQAGSWQYDIEIPGYKYNMTDISASLGIAQLKRYGRMLKKRQLIYEKYSNLLGNNNTIILPPFTDPNKTVNYHLMPIRIKNATEQERNRIIQLAASKGVSLNVHFIPINMHSAYTSRGYSIKDTPETEKMYQNEITLPLYSTLSIEDVEYIVEVLNQAIKEVLTKG